MPLQACEMNWPAWHAAQLEQAPLTVALQARETNWPSAQTVQARHPVAPEAGWYPPAPQVVQDDTPAPENEPGWHGTHCTAAFRYLPAAQGRQVSAEPAYQLTCQLPPGESCVLKNLRLKPTEENSMLPWFREFHVDRYVHVAPSFTHCARSR